MRSVERAIRLVCITVTGPLFATAHMHNFALVKLFVQSPEVLPQALADDHERCLEAGNSDQSRLIDRGVLRSENSRTNDSRQVLCHEVQPQAEGPSGGRRCIRCHPNGD